MSLVLGRGPIPPRRRSTVPVVPEEGGTGRTRSNTLGHGADNDPGVPVFVLSTSRRPASKELLSKITGKVVS